MIPADTAVLTADTVARWLEQHPDFFTHRDELLSQLKLPHHTGGTAISLVERQVSVLRDRNGELRHRLNQLMDAARQNDRLFELSRKLVLNLLDAQTLEDLLVAVEESLRSDFQADQHSLLLFRPDLPAIGQARAMTADTAREQLGKLLDGGSVCGVLRDNEREFLFGDKGHRVQSAAIVPLKHTDTVGLLALGSADPTRFQPQMGTLFLDYLAAILGRLLPRLLPAA